MYFVWVRCLGQNCCFRFFFLYFRKSKLVMGFKQGWTEICLILNVSQFRRHQSLVFLESTGIGAALVNRLRYWIGSAEGFLSSQTLLPIAIYSFMCHIFGFAFTCTLLAGGGARLRSRLKFARVCCWHQWKCLHLVACIHGC